MSEGWSRSDGAGTETETEAGSGIDAESNGDGRSKDAGSRLKGGWVALPPHPDAPGGGRGTRLRAPWATATTASVARTSPAPAPSDAPATESDTAATPKSRRFTLKRKTATETPAEAPPAPGPRDVPTSTPTDAAPPAPPAATRPAAGTAPAPSSGRAFEFTGSAGEYFRVWIVNVCLTVLTLGIYSAWAKVRTKRYLYRHTRLEGSPFDYLAQPMQILKGRAAVSMFFGAYVVVGQLMPLLQTVLSIAFIFLVPWAVVKSLRFRARNASWRNIRFGFDGTFGEAMAVFIGWPIAVAFTLGLAYPYYQWRRARFVTERSRFGTAPFTYGATPGEFYRVHMKVAGLVLAMLVVVGGAAAVLFPLLKAQIAAGAIPMWTGLAANAVGALAYLFVWTYARARIWNLIWDNTAIGPHAFESTVRARDLFRLYLMNTLGIIVSFGLLVPWARVRMARYRVEHMNVTGGAAITEFAQGQSEAVGATGAEFGEALDLDLGF